MSTKVINPLSDPIATLIDQVERKQQALEERARAEAQEERQETRRVIVEAFGEFWPMFEPYIMEEELKDGLLSIYFAPEPLGLASFGTCSRVSHGANGVRVFLPNIHSEIGSAYVTQSDGFALFLKNRRDDLRQVIEERHIKEVESAYKSLAHAKEEETARAALARLIELEPAKESDWRAVFDGWQREQEQLQEDEQERQRLLQEKKQAGNEYRARYTAWCEKYYATLARNKTRVRELQGRLDEPYTVWQLTYALVADGDDGERTTDIADVFVFADNPDEKGYWPTFTDGRIEPRRFFNATYISAEIQAKPTDKLCRGSLWLGDACEHIYFRPSIARSEIEAMVALEPLPVQPAAPEQLSSYEAEVIRDGEEISF